jgi:hypothetical protein
MGGNVHQRLYTDVWQNWAKELDRAPTAQEVVDFARQLEEQYHIEGTLFYRQGANAPGLVDWAAVQQLLQGGT